MTDNLDEVRAELEVRSDELARRTAQVEDLQRRLRRIKTEAQADGVADGIAQVATELFPALDALDQLLGQHPHTEQVSKRVRAWCAPWRRRTKRQAWAASFAQGTAAVRELLVGALQRKSVATIAPQAGEPFDSREHQSLPDPTAPPGDVEPPLVVAQLLRTGYRTPDRVLREALVYVKTDPARPSASDQPTDS